MVESLRFPAETPQFTILVEVGDSVTCSGVPRNVQGNELIEHAYPPYPGHSHAIVSVDIRTIESDVDLLGNVCNEKEMMIDLSIFVNWNHS